jgi:hypothetical protein
MLAQIWPEAWHYWPGPTAKAARPAQAGGAHAQCAVTTWQAPTMAWLSASVSWPNCGAVSDEHKGRKGVSPDVEQKTVPHRGGLSMVGCEERVRWRRPGLAVVVDGGEWVLVDGVEPVA